MPPAAPRAPRRAASDVLHEYRAAFQTGPLQIRIAFARQRLLHVSSAAPLRRAAPAHAETAPQTWKWNRPADGAAGPVPTAYPKPSGATAAAWPGDRAPPARDRTTGPPPGRR